MLAFVALVACKKEEPIPQEIVVQEIAEVPPAKLEFGFDLNQFVVKRDTVRKGDTFGEILERNAIGYPQIFEIAEKARDSFDIRKLQVGKPYTLLCSKDDTLQRPQCFIYQPNKVDYVVIDFQDSVQAYVKSKPVKIIEREAAGIINGSLWNALDDEGLPQQLALDMSEVYAWTIDFMRLQEGDRFKVVYEQKYINDTISVGVGRIKAAYFEHKKEPFYAFEFVPDSTKGLIEYYDDSAKNLRRAFLKSPLKFGRLSSRYNLKRRIAYYGYRVRPHKGTDFAAPVGTPILATANGTVTESTRRGGNGKYVKIKHNATYSTQYLHMSRRAVKVGDLVKQGDVIGYIGMTGNTGGPHVCYRFWKNGKQVDPFREKLPEVKALPDSIKTRFLDFIPPVKQQLDAIPFPQVEKTKVENLAQNLAQADQS